LHKSIGDAGAGKHTLNRRNGALLYWAGNTLFRINVASGEVLSSEDVPQNGDCSFRESGGVCAFACSCSVELAACDTGKRIGASYPKTRIRKFAWDHEPSSSECFDAGPGLLGAGAGVAVLEVEDTIAAPVAPHALLGIDIVRASRHREHPNRGIVNTQIAAS